MIEELAVFSLKDLQNALNVLSVMERKGITRDAVKDVLRSQTHSRPYVYKKARRLSRDQRKSEFSTTHWGRRRK